VIESTFGITTQFIWISFTISLWTFWSVNVVVESMEGQIKEDCITKINESPTVWNDKNFHFWVSNYV